MSNEKQYADRDIMDLDEKGNYYFCHVDAMTGESLHRKSDIAAELGYRDMLIDTYRDLCAELTSALHNHYWSDCTKHSKAIEALIAKAEQLLGEQK